MASVSTVDGVLRASGGVEGYVSEGLSVSAGGMWLRSGDALSVSSVSSARLVSGGRVVADAGEGMVVSAGEDLSVSAGVLSVSSTGSVGVVGSTVSVESSGSLRAMGVDSVSVESSGGVSVSAVGALTGVSGGPSSYVSGGSVSVSGAEGVSGVFGEGAELTASAVRVSSSSVLDASTAGSVSVRGSEGVVVSSGGSVVRLSPEGEGEFVGFVWESARSFDSFENVVSPSVSEVEELLVVSASGPYARGASDVSLELYDGSSWVSVWSAWLGAEAYYSLGGLSVRFGAQSVSGMRVRSAPGLSPTFEGWIDVVVHFGRRSSGSVSVSSAWRIEASAGEEVSVSSMDVVVNAGGSVSVSSVEGVHVSASDVSVSSSGVVDVSSREVSVVGVDRLDAYGGEEVRVSGGSIGVESLGRLDGVAVSGVSLTTEDAVLRSDGIGEAYMGSGVVGVSSSLSVHAGSSLGVSTGVLSLSVEGGVEAAVSYTHLTLPTICSV